MRSWSLVWWKELSDDLGVDVVGVNVLPNEEANKCDEGAGGVGVKKTLFSISARKVSCASLSSSSEEHR
jgi:hypothetical protein